MFIHSYCLTNEIANIFKTSTKCIVQEVDRDLPNGLHTQMELPETRTNKKIPYEHNKQRSNKTYLCQYYSVYIKNETFLTNTKLLP